MANQLYNKFNKYWVDFPTILAIAIVLNPRYKMEFVEFVYDRLYGEESNQLVVLKTKLHALFNEYVSNSTRPTRPSTLRSSTSSIAIGTTINTTQRNKTVDDLDRVLKLTITNGSWNMKFKDLIN
ncbi:hypothetical protein Ddye_001897 [Dipteronia dyeriana]|uniref:hAT-like transposase RNase-H fold domain-containing protein n=1 Tax=Dipteronia dyeriana TaxID=168575 RepID=A0AAD9XQR1_9ROSI|nr:hypothetical protein Ddye_001897 [Dipteronia dyeriana]